MIKDIIIKIYFENRLTTIVNIIALFVSYYYNKSILWAIFHYVFGWPYLIYLALIGRFKEGKFIEIISSYF